MAGVRSAFAQRFEKSSDRSSQLAQSMHSLNRDHKATEYTAMADDAAMSGPQKEAYMLCSAAEGHLEEGDSAECIKKAEEALAKFKGFGNDGKKGVADALHIIIDAHRLEGYNGYKQSDAASKLAEEELAKFKADGDKRGQATMLLAQREITSDQKQLNKRREAIEPVEEALALAKEAGDKKLEARCLLESAFVHYTAREGDKMEEAANAALAIYEELSDAVGKGKALHMLGLSHALVHNWEAAQKNATDAKKSFEDAGKKRLEAGILHAAAIWRLMEGKAKKAAPLAEQALEICQGMEKAKRAEAVAAFTACEAHCEAKNAKNALKIAKEELEKFQKDGDKMEEAIVQEAMTIAHLASDAPEKAVKTIESARKIAEELGAKRYESRIMLNVAAAHLNGKEKDEAYEALEKSVELATEEDDLHQLAFSQRELATFCMYEKQDYKEAMKMANEAVDTAQKDDDKVGEGMGTMLVALCHALTDENGKALTAANEAQELYQEAGFPVGEAQALWMIAELKALDDKYEAALEAAEERLSIFREMKDLKMEAKTLELVASLHLRDQNHDEAEKVCKEAVSLAQKADDAEGEVQIQLLLCKVYLSQIEDASDKNSKAVVAKAAKVANDAVGVATKTGEKGVKGLALYWKAQTLMMDEKFQDALKTGNEAEALFKGSNEQGQGACLHLVGTIQQNLGQPERASETLEKGLALAQSCKDADLEYELATSIYNLQRRMQPAQPMMMDPAMMQQMMPAQGGGGGGEGQVAQAAAPASVAAKPKGLDPAFVRKQLMTFVKDVMATDDELELDSPFMEAGMDSLSSVSLMSMVAKEFQMALSPSLVFDFPTVRALEDHLVEESKNV